VESSAAAATVEATIKPLSFLVSIGWHLGRIVYYFLGVIHPAFMKSLA